MANQVEQGVSSKPVDGLAAVALMLNRELVPVVKSIRDFINSRFGDDVVISADYSVQKTDHAIYVDCTAGNVNVFFPSAVGWYREILVVKVDATANSVTGIAFTGEALILSGINNTALIIGIYDAVEGPLMRWRPAFGAFYRVG